MSLPSVVPTGAKRSEAKWRDLFSIRPVVLIQKRPLGFARGDG